MASILRCLGLSSCIPRRDHVRSPVAPVKKGTHTAWELWVERHLGWVDETALMQRQSDWIYDRMYQWLEIIRVNRDSYPDIKAYRQAESAIRLEHIKLIDFMLRTGPLPEQWFELARQRTVQGENWLDRRNIRDLSWRSDGFVRSQYSDDRRRIYDWAIDVELPPLPLEEPSSGRLRRICGRKPSKAARQKLVETRNRCEKA